MWPWYLAWKTTTRCRPVNARGHAQGVDVRPGRRQGVLPAWQPEAIAEQPADLEGVGGRQQEVVAEGRLLGRSPRTMGGGAKPAAMARSHRLKSRYVLPSRSVKVEPLPETATTGE